MAKQKINLNKREKMNVKVNNKSKKKIKANKFKKKDVGKRGRLIVRNLPYNCTEKNLAEVFGEYGNIIDISIPKTPGSNKSRGFGFVDFQSRLSADKAILGLSGKEFMGRAIYIDRAVSKDRFLNSNNKDNNGFGSEIESHFENADVKEEEIDEEEIEKDCEKNDNKNIKKKKEPILSPDDVKEEPEDNLKLYEEHGLNKSSLNKDKTSNSTSSEKPVKQQKTSDSNSPSEKPVKQPYEIPKKKKARIIIRNLSFKTTEEKLKNYFSAFGDVIDLNLLRRIDNSLVGCAFIEFSTRKSAVKAILATSGKPFLGRTIVVDWAIPIKDFRKVNKQNKSDEDQSDVKIKEEVVSDDENTNDVSNSENLKVKENGVKKEPESSEENSDDDIKREENDDEEEEDDDDDDDDEEESESSSDDGISEEESDNEKEGISKSKISKKRKLDNLSEPEEKKKPRFESHDVNEGRTVFIKNLPFSATNEDLKECVKQFGPIFYALVCVDPVTEHSRGTAFVKFKNKEDAEKCLSAGTSFTLKGAVLDPHIAIERDKIKELNNKKKEKDKDSRNLYLIKEGVVLAGTPAANGVSMADMSRRLQMEQLKTQMLKNLNMFISRNRLIIHNLPATYDDRKLRQLFVKYSRPNAVIQEARVMRDFKNVDGKGIGKSKEYGFVSFKEHEDALHALRNINNNPNIFTESKRPIVAFSIENKRILNLKTKRLERSKMNNPLCSDYRRQHKPQQSEKDNPKKEKRKEKMKKNWKNQKNDNLSDVNNKAQEKNFIGFTAKPGSANNLRSKYKLKVQAQLHHKNVNQVKKEKKKLIKMKPIKSIGKDPGEKKIKGQKKKTDDDAHFSSLVNKYKAQLMSDNVRKKWYE